MYCDLSVFGTYVIFCSSIRNCITDANEGNLVKKTSHIPQVRVLNRKLDIRVTCFLTTKSDKCRDSEHILKITPRRTKTVYK